MAQLFNPYDHFGFLTNRVARLLAHGMGAAMSEAGYRFPNSCIGVMADLWSKDGVTQKQLGISLAKTKSSVNAMLVSLEAQELIYKADHPQDKRNKLIYLTPEGRSLMQVAQKCALQMEQALLEQVSPEEIAVAKRVLTALYIDLSPQLTEYKLNS